MSDRPEVLQSTTYKIKPQTISEAVYITISDSMVNDELRPVEVFVNSKNMENFQWVTCVTRLLSGILSQSKEFPCWAIDELVTTYDPKGGYFIPNSKGTKANGIVAHIGIVILKHCEELKLCTKK